MRLKGGTGVARRYALTILSTMPAPPRSGRSKISTAPTCLGLSWLSVRKNIRSSIGMGIPMASLPLGASLHHGAARWAYAKLAVQHRIRRGSPILYHFPPNETALTSIPQGAAAPSAAADIGRAHRHAAERGRGRGRQHGARQR